MGKGLIVCFGASTDDKKQIYIMYVRSLLEQSAIVWHSSLSAQNRRDIERVQKSAIRIILGNQYVGYKKSLEQLGIEL